MGTDQLFIVNNSKQKLLGPAVKFQCSAWLGAHRRRRIAEMYKFYTPERQCVTCVNNFWILIICIHTSRFGSHCFTQMGSFAWNTLYSKILPAKSRSRRRRPAAQNPPSQALHWNLATGPKSKGILHPPLLSNKDDNECLSGTFSCALRWLWHISFTMFTVNVFGHIIRLMPKTLFLAGANCAFGKH